MGYSLHALIEYDELVEQHDGQVSPFPDVFIGATCFGNDSMLTNMIARAKGRGLPDRVCYETVEALTVSVGERDGRPVTWEALASPAQAAKWVADQGARWLRHRDHTLEISEQPTSLVSHPDHYNSARWFTLAELDALQTEYRRYNAEDGVEVAVNPGEPLPDAVKGFAGTDEHGRALLIVGAELGESSFWLERIITLMRAAESAGLANVRLITWLR